MTEQQIGAAVMVRRAALSRPALRIRHVLMIMLDSNIVAVSLPSVVRDLGAAFSDIEWVVSAYVLTFAALLMPSGVLADRYGRRRTALVGLSVFTLSSLLCASSTAWSSCRISPAPRVVGFGRRQMLSHRMRAA
jgi:MFS family permease